MARNPDDIADETAAAIVALLRDVRARVIETLLATPQQFQQVHRQRLAEINEMIQQADARMKQITRDATEQAAAAGDEEALDQLVRANIQVPAVFVGVSQQLVTTAAQYQADLVTDLSNWTRGAITKEVRRAVLGNTPIIDLIQRIGTSLDDPSIFKDVKDRAEAIARTEVSRVYNMANYEQSKDIAERYENVTKTWVHAGFGRNSRANHVRLDGVTIPFDEEFDLGRGITTPYPHHPGLPAREVVHCRCRIITSIGDAA